MVTKEKIVNTTRLNISVISVPQDEVLYKERLKQSNQNKDFFKEN